MIVVREDSSSKASIRPQLVAREVEIPAELGPAARAAQDVVTGKLDLNDASTRYGISAPLLETWVRALLAAGVSRRVSDEAGAIHG